jgi:hypothetical protein
MYENLGIERRTATLNNSQLSSALKMKTENKFQQHTRPAEMPSMSFLQECCIATIQSIKYPSKNQVE